VGPDAIDNAFFGAVALKSIYHRANHMDSISIKQASAKAIAFHTLTMAQP
tara:strand:+ start:2070 stop:2219 length:150 start_codon:yes stop_codon:yes gene_type:complete